MFSWIFGLETMFIKQQPVVFENMSYKFLKYILAFSQLINMQRLGP
jgi:hypothetical protein